MRVEVAVQGLMSLMVYVDVKNIKPCLRIGHSLSLIMYVTPTFEHIKLYIIIIINS